MANGIGWIIWHISVLLFELASTFHKPTLKFVAKSRWLLEKKVVIEERRGVS